MMQCGLTLTSFLERAGKLFPKVEIVSRRPDGSTHRCTYADLYRRAFVIGSGESRFVPRGCGMLKPARGNCRFLARPRRASAATSGSE